MRAAVATALIALAWHLPGPPVSAQDRTSSPSRTEAAQAKDSADSHPLARWLDAQAFTVATRHNFIEDALDETVQNRLQAQVQIRGRLTIDEAGRYSVNAGLFTGSSFTSGWNPTGVGSGEGTAKIYLKQLFVAAEPWQGIELQYGSVPPSRGQSTEITTYDNDGYLTAGRATVRRPRDLFFDQITVSVGYLGYLDRPFVFNRTGAFSRQNYWQVLASRQVLPGLTLSTDYSEIEDDGVLRQGATWRAGQLLVDTVTGEYGVRLRGGSHETAIAFSGEKEIEGVTVKLGYANVDPFFGNLNGDPYGRGKRVFTTVSFPLPWDLSASWFIQKEISPPSSSSNDLRSDLAVTWNVLKTLRRIGAVPGERRP
jgi:hypothetical protein